MSNGKLAMTASLIVLRWFPGFEMFKKMWVSKNTTDNQSLPSVILIYTIYFSNFIYTTVITNGTLLGPIIGVSIRRS